jgi:hypothetical protein
MKTLLLTAQIHIMQYYLLVEVWLFFKTKAGWLFRSLNC